MKKDRKQFNLTLIILVVTLGGLLFGYDTAVISGTVKYLNINFIEQHNLSETLANSLLGFTVSSALIGCVLGGFWGGPLSIKLGRKRSLLIAAFLFVFSAVGSAFPDFYSFGTNTYKFLTVFISFRIIGGVGVGLASMLVPMYIAEVAPANQRGRMVSFNQMAVVLGMLIVYFVNYFIATCGSGEQWLADMGWRLMFLSGIIPALLFFVLLFFVPESPRWLMMAGKYKQAFAVLKRISEDTMAEKEFLAIQHSLSQTKTKSRLFAFGGAVVLIGVLLSMFQQLVGINVVMYYAPEVFRNMGFKTDGALFQTIIVGIINLVATYIAILKVDKLGRRPLMMLGSWLMALAMLLLGTFFYFGNFGIGTLIIMLCYTAAFSLSWGPVTWVLLSEIFPNEIRSQAMSISVAVQWIANYLVSWTFPMMDKSTLLLDLFHGGFAYWLYGLMGILSALFIWKFVPETKGVSLEQIRMIFTKKKEV